MAFAVTGATSRKMLASRYRVADTRTAETRAPALLPDSRRADSESPPGAAYKERPA